MIGRNRWTYEQRVCLDMLWTDERESSPSERTRAFNLIFRHHLEACRVPGSSLTANTLNCQYAERLQRHKNTWRATWASVLQPPDTDEDRALRAKLTAQINGILRPGASVEAIVDVDNAPDTPPETPRRAERSRKATQNPYEWYADPEPATPVHQQR